MAENNTAKVRGSDLPISTKISIEICNFIRDQPLVKVQRYLQEVTELKRAVPLKRFNWNRGHKVGIGPGRYPVNASKAFLKLCNSLQSNAENLGLNVEKLVLFHAKADKGAARWHYTKKGKTKMKNSNIELMVKEVENIKGAKK